MADIISITPTDLCPENLIPFLSSQPILAQILREIILDRAISQIEYKPGDIADLPEAASQAASAIRQYKIQQFKLQQWGNQLGQYFLQRKRQLDQVVYSMVRTANPGLTQELYFRIQAEEANFAEVAQTYSQGPEALTNGIVGPVSIAKLPPQVAEKLSRMQPGKVSSPFKFQDQYVILKLEHLLPAQLNPQTQQLLLNELFETWLQAEVAGQMQQFAAAEKSSNNSTDCNNSTKNTAFTYEMAA